MTDYQTFLESKAIRAQAAGFTDIPDLNEQLFPFQRDVTAWALRRGRAALFEECGLGKSWQALEWARCVVDKTKAHVLILTPLAVAPQFIREGEKLGIAVRDARSSDVPDLTFPGIWVANYEQLHKLDKLIPLLAGVVPDESSILKAFDGKTRTQLIETFRDTPYKLCCTATPSPNDHTELGNHAEFLGVMTRTEMLATWFVHDGGKTQDWRLKGHARDDFWRWVCSWAVCLSKPSDLGYSDEGYDLPPLVMHEHEVSVTATPETKGQQGFAAMYEAVSLAEQRAVRKSTLADRVAKVADIVNGKPKRQQWLVWCETNEESTELTKAINGAVEVKGADSIEHKEKSVLDFIDGKVRVIVSKKTILGFGVNLQNCHNQIEVSPGHSYEQHHQAVRRSWRFGQKHAVNVHLIVTSADGRVTANLERKREEHQAMVREMVEAMGDITREELVGGRIRVEHSEETTRGKDWQAWRGDCVHVLRAMPDDSVDLSVYSPPFASLYTYSDSAHDMGNCKSDDEFMAHYKFMLAEQLRVTRPGRLSCVHCMVLPTSKARDGVIGIRDFPGLIVRAHEEAGWVFHSKVTVWKDPVTAMQRTKALGLLWKQLKKDSAMSRMGFPDEVLMFRKPGDNTEFVSHTESEFPVDQWQKWASPVWLDINPSDTLQYMSAREHNDERHICPLQLEVYRRCIRLWSNPGDVVLEPFGGIGSGGHIALAEGRRYLAAELKPSYFAQLIKNLRAAEQRTGDLFARTEQVSSPAGVNCVAP